jgi:hypothetical protein
MTVLESDIVSHGRDGSDNNPYSPLSCFALLLIVGLIVAIGPAIHSYLLQN